MFARVAGGWIGVLEALNRLHGGGTSLVHPTTARPVITVTTDGAGVVSHVGSRLLAGMADQSGLTAALSDALAGSRKRRSGHDPGRVLTDLAVLFADGGRSISDLAVLRDQPALFGPVASTATAWRVLDKIDPAALNRVRAARASARERLWAQRSEATGPITGHRAGGRVWPGLRIMLDATLITAHSTGEGVRGGDVLLLTELLESSVVSLGIGRVGRGYVPRP